MLAGCRQLTGPGYMPVIVRVNVDESRCNDTVGGVKLLSPTAYDLANGDYPSILDGDVSDESLSAGSVDDRPVTDNEVI